MHYFPDDELDAAFISEDGENWTPLCCSTPMTHVKNNAWANWECKVCGTLHLIWAEDWPDYIEEEED